jgi:hypothetical protein
MTKRLFNINQNVWVKLTPLGLEKLKADHEALFAPYRRDKPDAYPFIKPQMENGWYRFQLWDLMNRIGPHVAMGMPLVLDLGIVIETDDFSKPRDGEELPQ